MTERRLVSRGASKIEPATVDPRFTAAFASGSTAIVVLAIGVTWWLYVAWAGQQAMRYEAQRIRKTAVLQVNTAPLSVRQRQERFDYEKRQTALLSSYGWIDREKGIARIPLAKAMERLAADKEAGQ